VVLLSLSPYAQKQLAEGKISQGHAKVLIGLDEKKQKIVIDSIIGQKLSVRDTENMVKKYKDNISETTPKKVTPSLLEKYADVLAEALPFKHKLKAKSIEISFENEKEVEDFLAQLSAMNDKKINTLFKRMLK